MSANVQLKEVTCIRCPMGCVATVELGESGATYRDGATCARGREYAVAEATQPERSVATIANVPGCGEPLSLKTARPIPKKLMRRAVAEMKAAGADMHLPVRAGDIVAADLCGTGVPAIATKTLP